MLKDAHARQAGLRYANRGGRSYEMQGTYAERAFDNL